MTIEQLSDNLHDFKTEINGYIQANTTMLDKVIIPKLNEIVEQNKVRNHRIEKLEEKTDKRDLICQGVQDLKDKRNGAFWKWFSAVLVIAGIVTGILVKTKRDTAPIEFYYQKNDSTVYIPRMYIRSDNGELREVSLDYYPELKKSMK